MVRDEVGQIPGNQVAAHWLQDPIFALEKFLWHPPQSVLDRVQAQASSNIGWDKILATLPELESGI